MTAVGPSAEIPAEHMRLQPHIQVVVKAIQILMQDQFNIRLTNPELSLMRHYLNQKFLRFIFIVENHSKLSKYADSDDANLPILSLVMTLKFFFMYLKEKAKNHLDLMEVFKSDFHFYAAFVCASLLADKLVYEKLRPEISDTHDVFLILHKNIITQIRAMVIGELSDTEWWEENSIECLRMLKTLANYSPLDDTYADTLADITQQLPNVTLTDFEELFEKLGILTRFKHYPDAPDISDDDNFYNNFHDDNFSLGTCNSAEEYDPNDFEEVVEISDISNSETTSNSLTASYEGSTSSKSTPSRAIFNLCLYEKAFLQTLDYRCNLTFTLTQAYLLLRSAKQFVVDPDSNLDIFIERLDTFGEPKPRSDPTQTLRLASFENYKSVTHTRSSETCPRIEKANLKRFSY